MVILPYLETPSIGGGQVRKIMKLNQGRIQDTHTQRRGGGGGGVCVCVGGGGACTFRPPYPDKSVL